jgi:hypothetical protein
MRTRSRVQRAPGIPCALSVFEERQRVGQTPDASRRGNALRMSDDLRRNCAVALSRRGWVILNLHVLIDARVSEYKPVQNGCRSVTIVASSQHWMKI